MKVDKKDFIDRVYSIKKRFLAMYKAARAGHIACSLSCAEILTFLRFFWMEEKDSLILSKGHAAAALYSVLAEAGILTEEEIKSFYQNGTYLGAHPSANKDKGIPFATGSLGHGLSLSAGRALASRLKGEKRVFFCVTSDGELNEGSTWEAALFIVHHKLDNLIWLIDRNGIQGFGRTEEVLHLEPLAAKLEAFGLQVIKAEGHSFDSLLAAKKVAESEQNKPKVILCNTAKGHGVSFMENTVEWHYLPMDDLQYAKALNELEDWYKKNEK